MFNLVHIHLKTKEKSKCSQYHSYCIYNTSGLLSEEQILKVLLNFYGFRSERSRVCIEKIT